MSTKAESGSHPAIDVAKWLLVAGLVAAGIWGNWFYQDQSLLFRVLGLLGIALVAVLIAGTTERGHSIWTLLKESRTEIRRVVWPTNQETVQTTLVVLFMIFIVAAILALLDWGLSSLITQFIG